MKLTDKIVSLFKIKEINDTAGYLVTSSLRGVTNLMPVHYTDVYLDEYILIPDLFAQKTKINLNENRYGLISVALSGTENKLTIEGPCNIIQWGHPKKFRFFDLTAGDILENWGNWSRREGVLDKSNKAKPDVFAQRGVIVLKAEKIKITRES
ncbi:MAG: hypothetical protein L3J54_00850 [Draconibacterium sp.]|nr:hypothetical protein [Draconibacterium sp.]